MAFDAHAQARKAGNVLGVNMVLLGALLQTGILPLSKESVVEAIKTKTKKAFVESNIKAFELGYASAENGA